MTINQVASKIAKLEGKKHQASIGDIREILKILSAMIATELIYSEFQCSPSFEAMIESVTLKKKKKAGKKR